MLTPHPAKVLSVSEQCEDTVTLRLSKPPGFNHEAGQFVVLQTTVDGKAARRSYSIASAPHEKEIEITVRRQVPGKVSPVLCALKAGDELGLLGPYGRFVLPQGTHPLVLISAGTGITPFIAFIRHLEQVADGREVVFINSARTPQSMLYADELTRYASTGRLRLIQTITRPQQAGSTWSSRTGRVTLEFLRDTELPLDAWYYVCGPTAMVVSVVESLCALGTPKERIMTEKFGKITA